MDDCVVVLDGVADGDELLRPLLTLLADNRPRGGRILLTSRREPGFTIGSILESHRTMVLRKADFSLGYSALRSLATPGEIRGRDILAVLQISGGWPEVAHFVIRIAHAGQLDSPFRCLNEGAWKNLFDWIESNVLGDLTEEEFDALLFYTACVGERSNDPEPSIACYTSALLVKRLRQFQLLDANPLGGLRVPPVVQLYLRARCFARLVKVANVAGELLLTRGQAIRAARVFLGVGALDRANSALPADREARATLADYAYPSLVLETMCIAKPMYVLYPSLWIALITARCFIESPGTLAEEADALLDSPRVADEDRLWILALAVILRGVGGEPSAAQLRLRRLREAADPIAHAHLLAIAEFYCDAMEGRESNAISQWLTCGTSFARKPSAYAIGLILASRAMYQSGESGRAVEALRAMDAASWQSHSPFVVIAAALEGASQSWFSGDRSAYRRYLASALELAPIYDVPAFRAAIVTHMGGDVGWEPGDDAIAYASALLVATVAADGADVRMERAVRAVEIADSGPSQWHQIAARMIASLCVAEERDHMLAEAKTIADRCGYGPLARAVEALRADRHHVGIMQHAIDRLRTPREPGSEEQASATLDFTGQRVVRGGEVVALSPSAEALLVFLALHPGVSKEIVSEHLWADLDGDAAANALKSCLHRLRQQLGDPRCVEIENGTLRLAASLAESATTELAEIVELGSVADGNSNALSEGERERFTLAFERLAGRAGRWRWDWFAPVAHTIAFTFRSLGTFLAEDALLRGQAHRALAIARTMGAAEPFDESSELLVLRALVAAGDPTMARAEYERYREKHLGELGSEPAPELAAAATVGSEASSGRTLA